MGLRDILTGRHTVKGPAPDRLFAISTAYVTLQAEHQIDPAGMAAIVFQALATSEFETTLREMEEVVTATGGESGTTVASQDDSFGYRWMVAAQPPWRAERRRPRRRHQRRLQLDRDGRLRRAPAVRRVRVRGRAEAAGSTSSTTTSAATGTRSCRPRRQPSERSTERELQLKAQMAGELPIEPELERWFPLWGIPI